LMVTLTLLIPSLCASNSKTHSCGAAGIHRPVLFIVPMVTLTLSVVDGPVDTVDCCFRFLWWLR
jgi:hypothetical protein